MLYNHRCSIYISIAAKEKINTSFYDILQGKSEMGAAIY